MDFGGQVISGASLDRLFVILVYLPICLIAFRFLFPRLSPASRRIAGGALIIQALIIGVSLEFQPHSLYEEWLWHISGEWNIPTVLSSTQLALIAAVALFISFLARSWPAWERLCFLGFALILIFLAADEFFSIYRQYFSRRFLSYIILGAYLGLTTLSLALRQPQKLLLPMTWLAGLSLIAFGGMVLDNQQLICGTLGLFRDASGCLDIYFLEESLEMAGGWLALVAMLGWFSKISPAPRPLVRRALIILPIVWIMLLVRASTRSPCLRIQAPQLRVGRRFAV